MKEIWKDVPGFEGQYQVSNQGRVRSLDRVVEHRNGRLVSCRGRVLKPAASKSGHMTVVLGRGNTKQVHSLVLLAFRGSAPYGMEGLHLNHIPGDNRLTNLKWGTRSENLEMDYEYGRQRRAHPVRAHFANGTTLDFMNVTSAASYCGVHPTGILQAMRYCWPLRNSLTTFESLR